MEEIQDIQLNVNALNNDPQQQLDQNQPQRFERVEVIELPKFMPECPRAWIAIAEARFTNRTQEATKYAALMRALPANVVRELLDVIAETPSYAAVSQALVDRFDRTADDRLRQLFSKTELGDLKPSQLLRRMKECAAGQEGLAPEIIPRLWRERLPREVQNLLEAVKGTPEQIASIADTLIR